MGEFQVKKQAKEYHAVIVGSGAGGGMAAYILAKAGLKVCIIEAGYMYDPQKNITQLKNPWDSPRRGASTKNRPFGDFDACYGGWNLDGEPFTKTEGTQWDWWRARMLGGRTNHWGRISLRFGPKDFKRRSIDGLGDDWPIGYEDVKPYYDRIDKMIGIFGTNEGLENDPDGFFLPPPRPRLHELFMRQRRLVLKLFLQDCIFLQKPSKMMQAGALVFSAGNAIAIAVWQKRISLHPMCSFILL
jgi:choline dehydrogenase-like flavoprotein